MNVFILYHTFMTIETLFTKQKSTAIHSVWLDRGELNSYLKLIKKAEFKIPTDARPSYRIKNLPASQVIPCYYSGNEVLALTIDGTQHQVKTLVGTEVKAPGQSDGIYRSSQNNAKTKKITQSEFSAMDWGFK
jgi:hypothetical protein